VRPEQFYVVAVAFAVVSTGWYLWRRAMARDIAEQWLRQHHYHVLSLRAPWLRMAMFAPSFLRNSNNAFDFEAIVEDRDLGGEARMFLRVWANWMGQFDGEVEVVIDEISHGEEAHPLMERLADAQSAVLHRIANGETAFYGPRRSEGGEAEFNELVEHVLALSRRGMITCGTPTVDGRNVGNYASIEKIGLTPAGRSWLVSQSTHSEPDAEASDPLVDN
jgi:hypothetical protein